MQIRKTELKDLSAVMKIYDDARAYMRQHGNNEQWSDGYPSEDTIINDIRDSVSYVVTDSHDIIVCVFAFMKGPDITYKHIYDGRWPDDNDYYVIHRIAVSEHRKGIASFVYDECIKKAGTIRIDTHKDNYPMQNSLIKNGFKYCGIIHLLSGAERLAYQKEGYKNECT